MDRKQGNQAPEGTKTLNYDSSSQKPLTERHIKPESEQKLHRKAAETASDTIGKLETTDNQQAKEEQTRSGNNRQENSSQKPDPPEKVAGEKHEKRGRVEKSGCLTGIALMLLAPLLIIVVLTLFAGIQNREASETIQPSLIEASVLLQGRQF